LSFPANNLILERHQAVAFNMTHTRIISPSESSRFAALSGDYNPIHTDAVAARRLLYGRTVIHGVHTLCLALDWWAQQPVGPAALISLNADFKKPVHAADELVISSEVKGDKYVLLVKKRGSVVLKARFATTAYSPAPVVASPQQPPVEKAVALQSEQLAMASGDVPLLLDPVEAAALFPNLVSVFGLDALAVILATTRVVGMKCPGLHSLYERLRLSFVAPGELAPALSYKVSDYDDRFGMLDLEFSAGGVTGSAQCYFRPTVVEQPGTALLKERFGSGQFAGQRALVIGGSRGLGEYTAKLIAAGGGEVVLSYCSGQQDAAAVVADILENGARASSVLVDTCEAGWAASWPMDFTHIYYFASPKIDAGSGEFNQQLYATFRSIFVDALEELFGVLKGATEKIHVFVPSSTYVSTSDPGFAEYIQAKTEMEDLCSRVAADNSNLAISMPRLPRLQTDQTAGPGSELFADTGEVLVPLLSEINAD
jgi:acyl dehydratase